MKIGTMEVTQEGWGCDETYEESSCCKKNKPTHGEGKCGENNGSS
jgi:hypothetical protein